MRPLLWLLLPVVIAGCERASARPLGPPARLVAGKADTVVVNSRSTVTLPVQVLDAAGHELPVTGLRFERVSGDSVKLAATGRITCDRRSDAAVRVSLGALTKEFMVRCRPIKGFRFLYGDGRPLVAGGPSRDLDLLAVGVDDMPERMLAGTMKILDSSVAELRGFTVHPHARGATMVELDLGECLWHIGVFVNQRVASPAELRFADDIFLESPLRLVDGERRGWKLPRGEYRVGLLTQAGVDAKLALNTTAMNCVPWITGGQDYNCVALEGASIDVRNPRRAGAGGVLYGELFAQRMDLPRAAQASHVERRPRARRVRRRECPMVR
jgi:hypothetical protein